MQVGILLRAAIRGLGSKGSLLAGICEVVEVIGEEAASGHTGARPAEALLLLGVDSQNVPPLPGRVILHGILPLSPLLRGHLPQVTESH